MASAVISQADGPIGRVTLNRPDAMNAITVELAEQLTEALRRLSRVCEVIVLRGAGGNFCVGGDFHELERLRLLGPGSTAELFASFGRACALIGEMEVPVVAAVEGYAMAGGFELLQACDIGIVRLDAKLADNHANYGQVPGGGGSQRLARIVGRQRASALILTGDRLTGAEAADWGLAYRAVDGEQFEQAVEDLLAQLASKTRASQALTKSLIRRGLEGGLDEGLELERRAVVEYLNSSGAASGIAAFNKRGGK